jgi:hypothetical protein
MPTQMAIPLPMECKISGKQLVAATRRGATPGAALKE